MSIIGFLPVPLFPLFEDFIMASEDIFSNYIPPSNSVTENAEPDILSEGPVHQNFPPRQEHSRERGLIDRNDSQDRAMRNLQEIELTVVDQDSRSSKQSFTCTSNVANKADKSSDSAEYITSDMFKAFMDAHNKQMETVQKSLDSLNSLYYEEVSEEEDYFSEEEEEVIPRKRSRIDQVSLSSTSSPKHPLPVQHAFHVLTVQGWAEVTKPEMTYR